MSHYYDQLDLKRIPALVELAGKGGQEFFSFEAEVYSVEGKVPLKTKELIAVAVAHVVGCPYCIDVHVQKYRKLGGTPEEIVEAVLVAASTRAGAVLSHATQALKAFEQEEKEQEISSGPSPSCFC